MSENRENLDISKVDLKVGNTAIETTEKILRKKIHPIRNGLVGVEKPNEIHELLETARDLKEQRLQTYEQSILARRDPLTGLLNRRAWEERLDSEFDAAIRYETNLAVIMVDLDGLKPINDAGYHKEGDTALKELADYLNDDLRTSDVIARIGGDEFAVALRSANKRKIGRVLERLRERFSHQKITIEGKEVFLSASFGVTFVNAAVDKKARDVQERADRALKVSKNSGRNRVTLAKYSKKKVERYANLSAPKNNNSKKP